MKRLLSTVAAFVVYGVAAAVYNPAATLVTGKVAGEQFQNSDASAMVVPLTFSAVNGVGGLLSLALVIALVAIWYRPVVKLIADATAPE